MTRARRKGSRGGKKGYEPRGRIRLREADVLQRHLDGATQHQIAAALDLSQAAVSKILKRVEERVLSESASKIERQRGRQILRLEHLFAETMRAWNASKQDTLRKRQRQADGGGSRGTMAELISENRHGDPRHLEAARKILADLRALSGLDAPTRMAVHATTAFAELTDDAIEAELASYGQQLDAIRQRRALNPSPVPPQGV